MAEDAYRAALIHQWHMHRLNEVIKAIRELCRVIDDDMERLPVHVEAKNS